MSFKLMVAVPSHSETVVIETARSLLALQDLVSERSGSMAFHDECGSTISVSRNVIASEFMESDADILVMIDADTGVTKDAFKRMIDLDKPFVGSIYPMRKFNWSAVDVSAAKTTRELLYQSSQFVGRLMEDESGTIQIRNGFAPAEYVGAGVLVLRRQLFEALMEAYPELEGIGFEPAAFPKYKFNWGFFNPVAKNGLPISEDFSFCIRWRETGGEIWADVASSVQHIGRHQFTGNFLDFANAKARPKNAKRAQPG